MRFEAGGTVPAQAYGMFGRLAVLLTVLPLVAAADASKTTFPFELRDGFMWVKVRVAQSEEPLNFLVDSGAEVSTLNLQTAKRLKLSGGRPVRVAGVGGKTTGYWPQKLQGAVAGVELPTRFLVTDLCALESSCQCPVDGLLGADFFRDRIVQIDFLSKELRLLNGGPFAQDGEPVPIRFRRDIMQVPLTVNGKEQWVRLDTGCASALEWVSAQNAKVRGRAKMSIGLSGVQIPTVKTTVRLGNQEFERVETGVHARPIFASEDGLLGLGLIAQFEQVTVDAKAGRLLLSKSAK